jgi:peptide chain release factor 2
MSANDTSLSGDFKVEAINPNPPGGQHVGMTIHHIKVTHVPTGIYAVCMSERSQYRNRALAKRMVEAGLELMGWHQ